MNVLVLSAAYSDPILHPLVISEVGVEKLRYLLLQTIEFLTTESVPRF
jgi:hypothetical protein